jgi:four helix bundle protein
MQQRRSRSIVQEKSFHFAVQLVNYSRRLHKDSTDLVLTRQLLKSGTSIGANVEEASGGQSSKDFISKLAIAAKEAREAGYWLRPFEKLSRTNIRNLPVCWQNAASY